MVWRRDARLCLYIWGDVGSVGVAVWGRVSLGRMRKRKRRKMRRDAFFGTLKRRRDLSIRVDLAVTSFCCAFDICLEYNLPHAVGLVNTAFF